MARVPEMACENILRTRKKLKYFYYIYYIFWLYFGYITIYNIFHGMLEKKSNFWHVAFNLFAISAIGYVTPSRNADV